MLHSTESGQLFIKYLASTDHKVIGLLYACTSVVFLLVGFTLVTSCAGSLRIPVSRCRSLGAGVVA